MPDNPFVQSSMRLAEVKDNDFHVTGLKDAGRIALEIVNEIEVSLIVQIPVHGPSSADYIMDFDIFTPGNEKGRET